MKKKIFKRSMALGALMAFVITGNAMAAELRIDGSTTFSDYNDITYRDNKGTVVSPVGDESNTLIIKGISSDLGYHIAAKAIDGSNSSENTKYIVKGNRVNVQADINFNGKVLLGAYLGNATGELSNNVVEITKANVSANQINAARTYNFVGNAEDNILKNNQIIIELDAGQTVDANYILGASISSGGGTSNSGSIIGNTVTISGNGTVNAEIRAADHTGVSGDVKNNKVFITGVNVTKDVYGAYRSGNSDNVSGNSVEITDAEANKIVGVYLHNGEFAEVNGNTVELKGNTLVKEELRNDSEDSEDSEVSEVSEVSAVRLTDNVDNLDKSAKVDKVTGNNVTLSDEANVAGGIAGYKVGGEPGNKVTYASNNSLIIKENWTGKAFKADTLNKVENFDNVDIGWTESGKTLTIGKFIANSRSAKEGGTSESVKFRLNDISTKIEIENFVTQDKYGRVPKYDGREFNGRATIIGTGRVRDQFNDTISDKDNISKATKERLNDFANAVTVAMITDCPCEIREKEMHNDYCVEEAATDYDEGLVNKLELEESKLYGAWEADVKNGEVQVNTVQAKENDANVGIIDMANIALISWRAETNDMNKRMGELRNANGEHGVWVRMVRGEDEYGSIKHQYNQYQLGYDEKLSVDKHWTVGAALSYTDAENSFTKGNGDSTNKALSIYGSKLNDDGTFIDLIAKYARLENDFDVVGGAGNADYSTNGYSISAEFGKRIEQGKGLWIEPQVELTYGKVSSVDYVTESDVNVAQDGIDFLVGRVGFSLGKDIKQGNVYARASYLYDFDGETELTMIDNGTGGTRRFTDDLGGGWWEVGVGANINLSNATYIYADVEKTFGGEVDTNWQWNLGVRYSF